jgi:L-ascorbate metabolism protein UlaG (beta-lactamase superfamily)
MRAPFLLASLFIAAAGALPASGIAQGTSAAPPETPAYILTIPPGPTPVAEGMKGSVQFIGTATVLIRYQGITILTDPNFLHKGDHVHLGYGLTSERLTNPALELADLPPIDLVVLSHMHEDHFDKLVQRDLNHNTPIVTTREAAAKLKRLGFLQRFPLSRWEVLEVRKGDARLRLTSLPGRHGPPGVAVLMPSVMGAMLDFAEGAAGARYRIYISGDTLVYDDIQEIPRRFPDIDLALLHLGGTRILGVVKVTMDGKDGVRMLQIIAPQHAIPIHYNDYDVFKSPLSDFQNAVKAAGLEQKVIYLKHGEAYQFAPLKR